MRYHNRSGLHEKGSLNVQAYVDVKKIATIASFLEKTGELYAPQYGVISQYAINYLMAVLEEHCSQHLVRFNSTTEAIQWLDEHRFSMAQFSPNGNRRISRELAQESESREEFGNASYGLSPMMKSSMMGAVVDKPTKELPLHEREAMAKILYAQHGIIGVGYEYLFDHSIPNPNLSAAQVADVKQAKEGVARIMDEMLAQQDDRYNLTEEQIQANLRESAITLLLKNATSTQQMPIPTVLQALVNSPDVLEEVAQRIKPYLEQRDREMLAREEEKKLVSEEKARRHIV